jgi:hypothetical protein
LENLPGVYEKISSETGAQVYRQIFSEGGKLPESPATVAFLHENTGLVIIDCHYARNGGAAIDNLRRIEQDWETRPCSWLIETFVSVTTEADGFVFQGREKDRFNKIRWLAFDQKQCGWISQQLDEASMLPWKASEARWKAVAAELDRASGIADKLIWFLTAITALPVGILADMDGSQLLSCALGFAFLYYFTLHRLATFLAGKVLGVDQLKKAAAAGSQGQTQQAGNTKASRSKSPGSRKSKGSVKID